MLLVRNYLQCAPENAKTVHSVENEKTQTDVYDLHDLELPTRGASLKGRLITHKFTTLLFHTAQRHNIMMGCTPTGFCLRCSLLRSLSIWRVHFLDNHFDDNDHIRSTHCILAS